MNHSSRVHLALDCRWYLLLSITCFALSGSLHAGTGDEARSDRAPLELQKSASWQWPEVGNYEEQLASYLDQLNINDAQRSEVQAFWKESQADARGPKLLDRLLDSASLVEPRIAELSRQLRSPASALTPPGDLAWLTSDVPGWLQDTLRLAYGRAYAQRQMMDESLETLAGLELEQVCDPASLLFYRAMNEHHLLQKDQCLANVQKLLEREDELPVRYGQVAHLILADIQPLESDSLDEVSRLMFDVQRRLDLGRAGQRVQKEEKDIVDKLDKLIEKIEEQLQQQQQKQQPSQGKGNGNPNSQLQPMEDSRLAGGSGAGDVDKKDIGERAGWGNLPPAQRQEAMQRLTDELPSHYREVIEGYFRQLAKDRK